MLHLRRRFDISHSSTPGFLNKLNPILIFTENIKCYFLQKPS